MLLSLKSLVAYRFLWAQSTIFKMTYKALADLDLATSLHPLCLSPLALCPSFCSFTYLGPPAPAPPHRLFHLYSALAPFPPISSFRFHLQ